MSRENAIRLLPTTLLARINNHEQSNEEQIRHKKIGEQSFWIHNTDAGCSVYIMSLVAYFFCGMFGGIRLYGIATLLAIVACVGLIAFFYNTKNAAIALIERREH